MKLYKIRIIFLLKEYFLITCNIFPVSIGIKNSAWLNNL